MMYAFIRSMWIRGQRTAVNKSDFFEPPSIVWPRDTHFPGGNRCKIEIRIEYNCILHYFTLSIMYNSNGRRRLWCRIDDRQGAPAEMSAFFTKRLCVNSKDNSNFGMKDKKWQNRNTEVALWGSGVESTILRSTLFGKNSTLLRSTLLKRVIFDKIGKSSLFKE